MFGFIDDAVQLELVLLATACLKFEDQVFCPSELGQNVRYICCFYEKSMKTFFICRMLYMLFLSLVEGPDAYDETRERRSDYENSEDDRRRSKMGSFKKKAIYASSKFTHSFKKRGKRKVDYRVPSVSIEDIRDPKEESAVAELRQKLLDRDLLPVQHDDYHTLLR